MQESIDVQIKLIQKWSSDLETKKESNLLTTEMLQYLQNFTS